MNDPPLKKISASVLSGVISRTPLDHYVVWMGIESRGKPNSLRARALACVSEIWIPIQLRELLLRAAAVSGDLGYDPDAVRKAVHSHQTAKPAVHLLVRRTPDGAYVAVSDIPWPGGAEKPLAAGELVIDRTGRPFPGLSLPACA